MAKKKKKSERHTLNQWAQMDVTFRPNPIPPTASRNTVEKDVRAARGSAGGKAGID